MGKKEDLLETAIKLFVEQGFENTPTSQIAKEADVATGTLFYYFKTKEELINEAYFYVKKSFSSSMLFNYKINSLLKEKLNLIWKNSIHWGFKNKLYSDFLVRFGGSVYINKLDKTNLDPNFGDLLSTFNKSKNKQELKDIPDEIFEVLFMSLFQSFLTYFTKQKKIDPKTLGLSFLVFWDAIKK